MRRQRQEEVKQLAGGEVERAPGWVAVATQTNAVAAHNPPWVEGTHALQVLARTGILFNAWL